MGKGNRSPVGRGGRPRPAGRAAAPGRHATSRSWGSTREGDKRLGDSIACRARRSRDIPRPPPARRVGPRTPSMPDRRLTGQLLLPPPIISSCAVGRRGQPGEPPCSGGSSPACRMSWPSSPRSGPRRPPFPRLSELFNQQLDPSLSFEGGAPARSGRTRQPVSTGNVASRSATPGGHRRPQTSLLSLLCPPPL